LPELATTMNRFLHRSTGANKYATFFYAAVDPALFRDLAMARADGSLRGLLARLSRIDVLVMDVGPRHV
jgi:hypothetical protein